MLCLIKQFYTHFDEDNIIIFYFLKQCLNINKRCINVFVYSFRMFVIVNKLKMIKSNLIIICKDEALTICYCFNFVREKAICYSSCYVTSGLPLCIVHIENKNSKN